MHPDLEKLIVLQSHDLEARRLHEQVAALSKQVTAAEARAKAAAGELAAVKELIAKEEALRRREESEIADLREKVERARKKTDYATSAAQLTALEHEVAFARSEITRLEDAELESMERSEELEAKRTAGAETSADAAAALERERTRAAEVTAEDKAALAELEVKRTALRAEIVKSETGENSLSVYDRIAKAKGTAVSEAVDQKCSACQMLLRPQRWNEIRDNSPDGASAQTLMTCESCGRLLYYDPARDAPQRKSPQPELQGGTKAGAAGARP